MSDSDLDDRRDVGSVSPLAVTLAAAQLGMSDGNVGVNVNAAVRAIVDGRRLNTDLIVFPECFLSGYLLDSRAQIELAAITAGGPELDTVCRAAADANMHLVIGFLERYENSVFNSAALIGPTGIVGITRKHHLPYLGADRFVDKPPPLPLEVYATPVGTIGIHICYELRFPEVARTLALLGADIITLPTGWPLESKILPDHFASVRAAENLVYLIAANRPDGNQERQFIGRSQIIDPLGNVIARANRENILITGVAELSRARDKTIVFDAGIFHISPWADRAPHLYKLQ